MKNLFRIMFFVVMICTLSMFVTANMTTVESDESTVCYLMEKDSVELFLDNDLIPLAVPTNLKWNIDEEGNAKNGYISWDKVNNCEGEYEIHVYRDGEEVFWTNWSGLYDHDGNGRVGTEVIRDITFSQSGNYVFTIRAIGDEMIYGDSATAESSEYKFVCPSEKLDTPTGLEWVEFGVLRHKPVENASGYMYVRYDENFKRRGMNWSFGSFDIVEGYVIEDMKFQFDNYIASGNMSKIYIKVIALTPDIEVFMNSDQSEFSEGVDLQGNIILDKVIAGDVLDKLYSNEISGEEVAAEFKNALAENNISNTALAVSMQQDDDLVNDIKTLEEIYKASMGIYTDISNKSGTYLEEKGIDISDVQVVGAALNSVDNNNVNLVFEMPDPTISLDPLFYKNAVGVGIDMEGVSDNQNLEIPVQIRMPIPANVLPDRLMIIHCHKDGSRETIYPAIDIVGEKAYATFVLTSFSTFVFCNEAENAVIEGDLNGDKEVDMNDAILLLQYSMFPTLYPIENYEGSVDFTNDGEIDMNDAILLLQHSMFPELYPLH